MIFAVRKGEEKMKKGLTALVILIVSLLSSCLIYMPEEGMRRPEYYEREIEPAYPGHPPVVISISFIFDYLSNYGYWIRHRHYGYVWIPRGVHRSWRPYTYGRWVWTEFGWTWYSYFEWGWLPFHYGRWGWDARLGWFWVPDTLWAPAWVIWRMGDIYVGWAPLPPEVEFIPGYGLRWRNVRLPNHYWIFIEIRRFNEARLRDWIVPPERNITIINYTVVRDKISFRDNRMINDAFRPEEIERLSRRPVTRVKLQEIKKPESGRLTPSEMEIYKPEIKRDQLSPKSVLDEEEVVSRIKTEREKIKPEMEIDKIHRREVELLEQTQRLELENTRKKLDEETRNLPREQREKEIEVRLQELKKKHQEERKSLISRQQEEKQEQEKTVKKENLKKKGSDSQRNY